MSKASEYAKAMKKYLSIEEPGVPDWMIDDRVVAHVTTEEMLHIKGLDLTAAEALSLATWIQDTFVEPEKDPEDAVWKSLNSLDWGCAKLPTNPTLGFAGRTRDGTKAVYMGVLNTPKYQVYKWLVWDGNQNSADEIGYEYLYNYYDMEVKNEYDIIGPWEELK